MAIITATPVVPLSSFWTHESLLTQVRSLVNEYDSAAVNNYTIRQFINIAISQVAQLLRNSSAGHYTLTFVGTPDGLQNGLAYIDLAAPLAQPTAVAGDGQRVFTAPQAVTSTDFIPSLMIAEIDHVVATRSTAQANLNIQGIRYGNMTKVPYHHMANLVNGMNTQYRQSMLWSWRENKIYLYFGYELGPVNASPAGTYIYTTPEDVTLSVKRFPLLDNMQPPQAATSTYRTAIDVPDSHARLVMLMVQKMCLESIGKAMDPTAVNEIAMLAQKVTDNLTQDIQKEALRGKDG